MVFHVHYNDKSGNNIVVICTRKLYEAVVLKNIQIIINVQHQP